MIKVGTAAEARLTVQESDSAAAVAISAEDSFPRVFATSRMIALMEVASARVLLPMLTQGEHSVGVSVNVRHTAATPLGGTVRAVATYLGMEGKTYRFRVEAFDDAGIIGEGEHVRAIIDTARLEAGAGRRKRDTAGSP